MSYTSPLEELAAAAEPKRGDVWFNLDSLSAVSVIGSLGDPRPGYAAVRTSITTENSWSAKSFDCVARNPRWQLLRRGTKVDCLPEW